MEITERDRLGTRLLAINIRLWELNHEMEQTQIRVRHLESQLEDARLAGLLGEDAGNPQAIGTQLEQERSALEERTAVVERVKEIQWKARVQHAVASLRQRQAELRATEGEGAASPE